jgi:GDP-D-mannose dehydratase
MVGIVAVMWVLVQYEKTDTVHNETIEEVIVEEVKEVTPDVIEKARLELERINQELDVKETELLEQRKQIDVELERLRQTRVSFQ